MPRFFSTEMLRILFTALFELLIYVQLKKRKELCHVLVVFDTRSYRTSDVSELIIDYVQLGWS